MRLANPTTAAQYFHLLRRQARIAKPRPLVVFTPKGLLRLEAAASKLDDLTEGALPVRARRPARRRPQGRGRAPRALLGQGLLRHRRPRPARERRRRSRSPGSSCSTRSPKTQIAELIASYPNLKEIVWAQEEPQNMGAWKVDVPPHARADPRGRRVPLRRPPAARQPLRGLPGRAPLRAGADRAHRAARAELPAPHEPTPMPSVASTSRGPGPALFAGSRSPPTSSWRCSPRCSSSGCARLRAADLHLRPRPRARLHRARLLIWIAVLRREAPYWLLAATLTPVGPVGSVIGIGYIERRDERAGRRASRKGDAAVDTERPMRQNGLSPAQGVLARLAPGQSRLRG